MEKFFKGIPASGRISIGRTVVLLKTNLFIPKYQISKSGASIKSEIEKLNNALMKTRDELLDLKNEIDQGESAFKKGYLDSALLMIEDPLVQKKVTEKITESYINIEWIFNEVIQEMADQLLGSKNHYFRERAPDVISIGHKVLKNLMGRAELDLPDDIDNVIIVAHTLSPPEIVSFYKKKVKAFVTEIGDRTSHVAIMARDIRLPAVTGVKDITKFVTTGTKIIVDGNVGMVIVDPEKDTELLYTYKERDQINYEKNWKKNEKKSCVLKDGEKILLQANMDLEEELILVKECGCRGIGLFRTEYIFFNRTALPDENEQFKIYKKIVKEIAPYDVTIRVVDIGGDKKPEYLQEYEEANPFLGLRGIRFVLVHSDILKAQIRAILRAAYFGNARIMFPMVNDVDELRQIHDIVRQCKDELAGQKLPFNGNIALGIMVETVSSVLLLDKISEFVDFISVGTNDLIQYTLAIDRGNEMVAEDFDPGHPAILRLLKKIYKTASTKGVELSICGEMAGDPLYSLLLIGLGFRRLSMSTMSIPIVKNIIMNSSLDEAQKIAETSLDFSLKHDVSRYIRDEMISRFKFLEDYFRQNA